MSERAVLVTGCGGGLGSAIVRVFCGAGWQVVGTDIVEPASMPEGVRFVAADLAELSANEAFAAEFFKQVRAAVTGARIGAVVNNAATQRLGRTQDLPASELSESLAVNVVAPFVLGRSFLDDLRAERGVVLNVGSVHAQATKPGFVAYATSKAALHGLTRALAVDLGPEVRVNTLAPAAVGTEMLHAGFAGQPEAFAALEGVHPAGRIATTDEIARLVLLLAGPDATFLTGSTLYADGGILSRLHDPA